MRGSKPRAETTLVLGAIVAAVGKASPCGALGYPHASGSERRITKPGIELEIFYGRRFCGPAGGSLAGGSLGGFRSNSARGIVTAVTRPTMSPSVG
jgi:hypothetical protein